MKTLEDFETEKLKEILSIFDGIWIESDFKFFLSQTLKEYRELIKENLPKKEEYEYYKRTASTEGFNEAIDQMESLLE